MSRLAIVAGLLLYPIFIGLTMLVAIVSIIVYPIALPLLPGILNNYLTDETETTED